MLRPNKQAQADHAQAAQPLGSSPMASEAQSHFEVTPTLGLF
jgi:hypothetical protein